MVLEAAQPEELATLDEEMIARLVLERVAEFEMEEGAGTSSPTPLA